MRTDSQRAQRAGTGQERARRWQGDRGAILAEAALVTPFFVVMLFGVLEFGGLFRDYLTLGNASAAATRQGAIAGDKNDADGEIMAAVLKASAAMPPDQILTIVVWHATGPNDTVPSGCAGGTPTAGTGTTFIGACNVYTSTASKPWWTWNTTNLLNCDATSPQKYWCPADRKTAVKSTQGNGPPDYLGIYIKMRHPWITGLFGSSITLTSSSITRLETTVLA